MFANFFGKKLFAGSRWALAVKTVPFVLIIIAVKFFVHYESLEFLTLNSLFTAIISANIFLIGFLISGTLVDYKESEKIPGDVSASLETMADEGLIIYKNKGSKESKEFLKYLAQFGTMLVAWFYKKEKTNTLLQSLRSCNDFFLAFESQTQANFIVRLKQEQHALRKAITRVHTIRETSFLGTGYAIAEIITSILVFGLVFIKMEPFYESMFFVSFVSFILIYMIFFIKDLDNPFGYSDEESLVENVSLKPLADTQKRIEQYVQELL